MIFLENFTYQPGNKKLILPVLQPTYNYRLFFLPLRIKANQNIEQKRQLQAITDPCNRL